VINSKIKQNTQVLEQHLTDYKAEKENLVTKNDLKIIQKMFVNYCSFELMDNFKEELRPLIQDA